MQTNLLLDQSRPFDQEKVRILDQVVGVLYSGDSQKVGDYERR